MTIEKSGLHRRNFVNLGAALTGLSILPNLSFGFSGNAEDLLNDHKGPVGTLPHLSQPGIIAKPGLRKPVYLAEPGVKDPATLSVAETLFWSDIMQDHAKFIQTFLADPGLAPYRAEAARFQNAFHTLFLRASETRLSDANVASFNSTTINLLRPFVAFKRKLLDAQSSGAIRSLAFPSFLHHVMDEGEQASQRIALLAERRTDFFDRKTMHFWLDIMSEHFALVSHLLDPKEKQLIANAQQMAQRLQGLMNAEPGRTEALTELKSIIAVKEQLEQKVIAAEVASIIHPDLADHVRREAEKAADDIRRMPS